VLANLKDTLSKTRLTFKDKFGELFQSGKPREEILDDLVEAMILADVGIPSSEKIVNSLREESKKNDSFLTMKEKLEEQILKILSQYSSDFDINSNQSVVMLVGINGGGKTTSLAKLAYRSKKEGRQVLIVAADTFRAAAQEQLVLWGKRLNIPVIKGQYGADPAAVIYDAIQSFKTRNYDLLLVDTAGRIHTNTNLMLELEKIKKVIHREIEGAPQEILLVLDASIGQNALVQAREFLKFSGITGVFLTKLDGTAKGGSVISVVDELQLPIKFIGVGEGKEDLLNFSLKDFAYLKMAYALAEKAKGWAGPNPYVGAVLVRKDVIVGYGYHEGPGNPHAEVVAFQKAGSLSKGSTAYITLEPCVHWGRTPPCVESIIQAGLKKVVISSLDPNPLVYRKGIRRIREAGIDVVTGLFEEKNRVLNECYLKYITRGIPFVAVKAAVSLDGKIATRKFLSQWISSSETREYVQLLRGEYDAIMIGVNTLIKDDPMLTVRHPNWKEKRITRVIVDSNLRFPLKAKMLSTLDYGDVLVFTLQKASPRKADMLRKRGVRVIPISSLSSLIDLNQVLTWLGRHEISSILVEGGGYLLTSMIEERLVDKVFLSVSPRLIGGERAPSLFRGEGADLIKDSLSLEKIHYFQIGDDLIVEGYF